MASKPISPSWDAVIAGGGPAGFFAAIRCAELNPHLRVLILERASQTLGKVLISGGGRCNVTHACFDPLKLVTFYPRGGNELRGAFSRFQASDTVEWFEARGVKLKAEADGRMSAKKAGVEVRTGSSLLGVEKDSNNGFRLEVRSAHVDDRREGRNEATVFSIHTHKLLLATGSDRKTLDIIKSLGHSVAEPVPSLFTFHVNDKRIDSLAGVSVENVTLKMDPIVQRGALLITHWGMSGPAVLRASAWGARELHEKKYRTKLLLNWLGDTSLEKALEVLNRNKEWKENARKKVSVNPAFTQIPLRLWKQSVEFIGEKNWADISKGELRQMANELTAGEFMIEGKGQFKEEFVTCGGVKLNEVDFKTMQSRVVDGLFFAGEVLNIDGITGGFNFQSSWTTGWLAGSALP